MYYNYSVTYYDDFKVKSVECKGKVYGDNYATAMKNVFQYYGEEYVEKITLEYVTDDTVLEEIETELEVNDGWYHRYTFV